MNPCEHKVQYYETDGMGIVHHSNYIRWFEEARVDLLEQLGFGYRDLIDVIEGHDRYASEILRYRFDVRELEERKEDAVCTTVRSRGGFFLLTFLLSSYIVLSCGKNQSQAAP